jgi:hypothetical protein
MLSGDVKLHSTTNAVIVFAAALEVGYHNFSGI